MCALGFRQMSWKYPSSGLGYCSEGSFFGKMSGVGNVLKVNVIPASEPGSISIVFISLK